MPTLDFKGKHHIYAHHLTVPYQPLEPNEKRSCNPTGTDDNLIIHGDNLKALKAPLRVMCAEHFISNGKPIRSGSGSW